VESSPSLVTLMVSAVLLLVLHQNEPALAADGCPTPGFTAARTFQAGSYPFFVAVGELNSDGKLDLVTANEYSDNVSVLWAEAMVLFRPPSTTTREGTPNSWR